MVGKLFDPVVLGLLLVLAGLVRWTTARPRRSSVRWKALAWTGFCILWFGASPWASDMLARSIEPPPTDLHAALMSTDTSNRTLVVLSGGRRSTPDTIPAIERLDTTTQARLLGAARIYRDHGPFGRVVVTGTGVPFVSSMAEYLALHGIPIAQIELESQATDTITNATFTAAILERHAPSKVVLVTSAVHMPRSVISFRNADVDVVPAPVDYIGGKSTRVIPSSNALVRTARVVHEVLGRLKPLLNHRK